MLPADRQRLPWPLLFHVLEEVLQKREDQLLVRRLVERRAGRLVHHVPHDDAAVVLVAADHVPDVLFELGPVLLAEPILSRVCHPVLVAVSLQVRELAEARVEHDGHHAEFVLRTQGQGSLESFEKPLWLPFVDGELQEHADRVQPQPLGIPQFAVDHRGIKVQPQLDVVARVGWDIVGSAHGGEILRRLRAVARCDQR
jgi:hypothetical protein